MHRRQESTILPAMIRPAQQFTAILLFGAVGAAAFGPSAFATTPAPAGAARSAAPAVDVDREEREIAARERDGRRIGTRLRTLARAGAPIAEQRAFLDKRLRAKLPRSVARQVLAEAVDGIAIEATKQPRASHLGGSALTVPGETWPANARSQVPLALVAVLDLAELKAPAPLPPDGSLVFYYDAKGPEVEDSRPTSHWMDITVNAEVRWIPAGTPTAEVAPPATTLTYPRRSLAGHLTPTYGGYGGGYPSLVATQRMYDRAANIVSGIESTSWWTEQLLGASQDLQGAVVEEIPYWFKTKKYASERDRYSAEERAGKGWTLLAQISGANSDEMYFGDMGIVSYLVPTTDLAARRFDRVVAILQF